MRTRWRLSFLVLVWGIGLLAFGALALNLMVNPMRVTPSPLSIKALDPYREIAGQMRTGKAGILRSGGGWQVMIAGSSRVAHGFDPQAKAWAGKKVVNLGLSGGFLYETDAMLRYALGKHRPEWVIIGIDPTDLSTDFDSRKSTDFPTSPLAGDAGNVDRELRYLCGISTAELSFKVLKRALTGERSRYSTDGFRMREDEDETASQLDFVMDHLDDEPVYVPKPARKEKMKVLEELSRFAVKKGCRVTILFLPMHAVAYAEPKDLVEPQIPFETERRALCEVAERSGAEFWDFGTFTTEQCDPLPGDGDDKMMHWNDLGHFTPQVGETMIARLQGLPETRSEFGVEVISATLETHLKVVGDNYRRYLGGTGHGDLAKKEEWRKR